MLIMATRKGERVDMIAALDAADSAVAAIPLKDTPMCLAAAIDLEMPSVNPSNEWLFAIARALNPKGRNLSTGMLSCRFIGSTTMGFELGFVSILPSRLVK
jgi:hypothetical protein